jgi:hypothetical protein
MILSHYSADRPPRPEDWGRDGWQPVNPSPALSCSNHRDSASSHLSLRATPSTKTTVVPRSWARSCGAMPSSGDAPTGSSELSAAQTLSGLGDQRCHRPPRALLGHCAMTAPRFPYPARVAKPDASPGREEGGRGPYGPERLAGHHQREKTLPLPFTRVERLRSGRDLRLTHGGPGQEQADDTSRTCTDTKRVAGEAS